MTVSDLTLGGHKVWVFQDLSQTTLRQKEGSEQNYSLPDKAHVKYQRSFLCKCILRHQEQQRITKGKRWQLKSWRSWNAWGNVWNAEGFSIILPWVREGRAAKPERGELQNAEQGREESGKNHWREGEARGETENRETEKMEGKRMAQGHKQRLLASDEHSSTPQPHSQQWRTWESLDDSGKEETNIPFFQMRDEFAHGARWIFPWE